MNPPSARPAGQELVLALVGMAAVILVLPIIAVAGNLSWWMVIVAVPVAGTVFARRDSGHGLVALAAVTWMWLASGTDATSPWTLAVALLMFTAHATLALRTTAPPNAAFGWTVVKRWLGRSGVVAALTAVVYLLVLAFGHLQQSDAELVLAVALAVMGGLILLLRSETLDAQGMARRERHRAYKDKEPLDRARQRRLDRSL